MFQHITRKRLPVKRLLLAACAGGTGVLLAASPVAASQSFLQTTVNNIVGVGYPGAWVKDTREGSAAAGLSKLGPDSEAASANKTFRIGSVTKSFVGAVALQMVDEHKIALTDTVEQWLPGLLPYGNDVTVRQLLQHTSGIPDYLEQGSSPLEFEFIRKSGR